MLEFSYLSKSKALRNEISFFFSPEKVLKLKSCYQFQLLRRKGNFYLTKGNQHFHEQSKNQKVLHFETPITKNVEKR